jgi:hypothetical protein
MTARAGASSKALAMLVPHRKLLPSTTGKPTFAIRQNLCRAFCIGRTAKKLFVVRFFIGRTAKQKRTANRLFVVRPK